MQFIEGPTNIAKGDPVWIMERGQWVGPFIVRSLTEGRTPDHIVLSGRGYGIFEHYADEFNTKVIV